MSNMFAEKGPRGRDAELPINIVDHSVHVKTWRLSMRSASLFNLRTLVGYSGDDRTVEGALSIYNFVVIRMGSLGQPKDGDNIGRGQGHVLFAVAP